MKINRKKCKYCEKLEQAKGLCAKHYWRVRNNGDPHNIKTMLGLTIKEKLEKCVVLVTESGCHIWMHTTDEYGYGFLKHNNKQLRAHRASYEEYVGEIPKGILICHTCDVPSCINPNHLFLGTYADNSADMVRKGRHNSGQKERSKQNLLAETNRLIASS